MNISFNWLQNYLKSDLTPEEVELSRLDAVIFPGGMPGASNLDISPFTDVAIEAVMKNGGRLAAICAAPFILGKRGILLGKRAVCYPGFENELLEAKLSNDAVAVDGKIITAKGAGVAVKFALKLVELLTSKEKALNLEESLQCK